MLAKKNRKLISLILIIIIICSLSLDLNASIFTSYQATLFEYYKCRKYVKLCRSPWKRILCIGDSITLGILASDSEEEYSYLNSYPLVMGELLNTRVTNAGIGGSTISFIGEDGGFAPMCERIVDYENDYDAVFVMGGINDWMYGYKSELGDLQTPNTFTYDFNKLCSRIAYRYKDADVYILIPLETNLYVVNKPYNELEEYREIERKFAEFYGFNIIDLPTDNIMNPQDERIRETFFSDEIHLNINGYSYLAMVIAGRALKIKVENN